MGRLVKSVSEITLLLAGQAILVVAYFLLPWTPALTPLLIVLGLLSIGTSFTSSLLPTLVSKRAAATEQGSVLGITQAAGSLARAIGPVFGGVMLAYSGRIMPFLACAGLTLLALILSSSRLK